VFKKKNLLRYANVTSSDECREALSTRGEELTKGGLTGGLKTDEDLHRLIIKGYNNLDKHNTYQKLLTHSPWFAHAFDAANKVSKREQTVPRYPPIPPYLTMVVSVWLSS